MGQKGLPPFREDVRGGNLLESLPVEEIAPVNIKPNLFDPTPPAPPSFFSGNPWRRIGKSSGRMILSWVQVPLGLSQPGFSTSLCSEWSFGELLDLAMIAVCATKKNMYHDLGAIVR